MLQPVMNRIGQTECYRGMAAADVMLLAIYDVVCVYTQAIEFIGEVKTLVPNPKTFALHAGRSGISLGSGSMAGGGKAGRCSLTSPPL